MQVSSPAVPGAAALAPSPLVDQVKRRAAILADGSGAATADKVAAYTSIMKAMTQSGVTGAGWFQQSSQADRDAVNAVMDTASTARDIRQAADDFNARGMRADRTTNVMADQIRYLNSLHEAQQMLIFAGTASLDQTPTLDSWKAFLQQNADARDRQMADEAAETPAVKVILSDKAKAALGASGAASADDPAASALATLTASDPGVTVAGAALKMLEDAADRRAAAKADALRVYQVGDQIDTSA
jgi:hypothetical protein